MTKTREALKSKQSGKTEPASIKQEEPLKDTLAPLSDVFTSVTQERPLTPGMVQALQRHIGNHATIQILQTHPDANRASRMIPNTRPKYLKSVKEQEEQEIEESRENIEQHVLNFADANPPDDNNKNLSNILQRACGCTGACGCDTHKSEELASGIQAQPDLINQKQMSSFQPVDDDRSVTTINRMPSSGSIQRGFFSKVGGGLKKGAKAVGSTVKKGAGAVASGVKKGVSWAGETAGQIGELVKNPTLAAMKKLAGRLLSPVKASISATYNKVICPLIGKLTPKINFDLSKLVPMDFEKIKAFVRALIRGAITGISATMDFIKDIVGTVKRILGDLLANIWAKVDMAMKGFLKGIANILGKIGITAGTVDTPEMPGSFPEIPGIPSPDAILGGVGDKADTGQAHLMTGGQKINEWRSKAKKQTDGAKGKLVSIVSDVINPVRDFALDIMSKCLEQIPVLGSVVDSAKKLKDKFMKLVVVAGDVVMIEAVDAVVQEAPCTDGESKATIKAGASVPIPLMPAANFEGGKALEISKRGGGKVAFKHINSSGVSVAKGGASAGAGFEDAETYVYDKGKEGDMFNAGVTTFYKQATSSTQMFMPAEVGKGIAENTMGVELGDKKNLESTTTGFYVNIGVSTDNLEFMSGGKAQLEEFTTGDKRLITEISGKIKLTAGNYSAGDNDNLGDMDSNLSADMSAKEIDGATMAIEVNIGADGKVKDVSYIITADTPNEEITRKLFGTIDIHEKLEQGAEKQLNKKYKRQNDEEKIGVDIGESKSGTYEIRYTSHGGANLDTNAVKKGDFTQFQKIANQIKDSGTLVYIREGTKKNTNIAITDKKSGVSGNAGLTQESSCDI